jgi:hypothetical protein
MIKQQGGIPRYQATFKLSQRRAWHQRLTPLAWFCVFLGGLGTAAVLITVMNFWVASRNGTQSLSGQQMSQAATQSRVVPTQSPAKYVVIARPTARPAMVAVAPKPVKNANPAAVSASSDGVVVQAYNTASSDSSASGDATSGTGKKGSGSNLIATQLAEYYKSIKEMPMGMYLAERETLLPTYFHGNGLNAVKADEVKRETYDFIKAGDVEVRVVSVKGQTAVVKIKQKSWVSDIYDVKTGEVKEADVKKDIVEQTMSVVYDPKDGRWKFAENFAPAVADASADGAAVATPAAKPAAKKVVKPVKPVATPVVQVSP